MSSRDLPYLLIIIGHIKTGITYTILGSQNAAALGVVRVSGHVSAALVITLSSSQYQTTQGRKD